jgi:hypothetical protein
LTASKPMTRQIATTTRVAEMLDRRLARPRCRLALAGWRRLGTV